jgi:hypothetical protein
MNPQSRCQLKTLENSNQSSPAKLDFASMKRKIPADLQQRQFPIDGAKKTRKRFRCFARVSEQYSVWDKYLDEPVAQLASGREPAEIR